MQQQKGLEAEVAELRRELSEGLERQVSLLGTSMGRRIETQGREMRELIDAVSQRVERLGSRHHGGQYYDQESVLQDIRDGLREQAACLQVGG